MLISLSVRIHFTESIYIWPAVQFLCYPTVNDKKNIILQPVLLFLSVAVGSLITELSPHGMGQRPWCEAHSDIRGAQFLPDASDMSDPTANRYKLKKIKRRVCFSNHTIQTIKPE